MSEVLHFFGYAKVPWDHHQDNPTGFFEYSDNDYDDCHQSKDELRRVYKGWQAQNTGMVNWVCQLSDADLEQIRYKLYDKSKEVPLLSLETENWAKKPTINYYTKKLYKMEHID